MAVCRVKFDDGLLSSLFGSVAFPIVEAREQVSAFEILTDLAALM